MLARISRTRRSMISVWDVLSTMTRSSTRRFATRWDAPRDSSPLQYRMLEFCSATRRRDACRTPTRCARLRDAATRTRLTVAVATRVLRLLSRRGYEIPQDYLSRDFSEPYQASKQVARAWLGVYHNAQTGWDLYELAERLVTSTTTSSCGAAIT